MNSRLEENREQRIFGAEVVAIATHHYKFQPAKRRLDFLEFYRAYDGPKLMRGIMVNISLIVKSKYSR